MLAGTVRLLAPALCAALAAAAPAAADDAVDRLLARIKLPPGFEINLFARVPDARQMVVAKPLNGVFVGSKRRYVYLLLDRDRDGVAETVIRKTGPLDAPNGVALQDGALYVGTRTEIVRSAGPAEIDGNRPLASLIPVLKGLPTPAIHGLRVLSFGPDRKLYVAIGTPCNVCMPKGHQGQIVRTDPNGENLEVVARGIRNSLGFDWHPKTKEMFFTDNGSDRLGDDIPPDELNHVTALGQDFGYPYYGGGRVRTPEFKDRTPPAGVVFPVVEFQAHTANLGIHFYDADMFPAEYRGDAFVAQHGSWNRSTPVGYRVMRVRFDGKGMPVGKEVFASGWLEGEDAWGRPVDIKTFTDGSLLVSDDFLGAVYRISYRAP